MSCCVYIRTRPCVLLRSGIPLWNSISWFQDLDIETQKSLLSAEFYTNIDFAKNPDWYPMYIEFGRVLSYDVSISFEGLILPDVSCAYALHLYSDNAYTTITIKDPTDMVLLDASVSRLPMLQKNQYKLPIITMAANTTYAIKVNYYMPFNLGTDPTTGEIDVNFVDRELRLLWSCPSYGSLYTPVAIPSRNLLHFTLPVSRRNRFAAYKTKPLYYSVSIFGPLIDALAAVLPSWDTRVTGPLFLAGDWMRPLFAPLYAGLCQPAELAIKYFATLISAIYSKTMYLLLALGVKTNDASQHALSINAACMAKMGLSPRAYADGFMESLPELVEFFLDIKESRGQEGVSTCSTTEHENLILSGSLKMYYFASQECNVRYADGALVRCSMEDGLRGAEHCAGFTMPAATFNTNFLCAFDDLATLILKKMVWSRRLIADWAEGAATETIKCIAHPSACNFATFVDATDSSINAALANTVCNTFEVAVRASTLVPALLSPAFALAYAASGHPTVQGGLAAHDAGLVLTAHHSCGMHATHAGPCSASNVDNLCYNHSYPHETVCEDVCTSAGDESTCMAQGACAWMGTKCMRSNNNWLTHQSYPLEAALATLITSFVNYASFWPAYTALTQFQAIQNVFMMQADVNTCSSCSTSSPTPARGYSPPPYTAKNRTEDMQALASDSVTGISGCVPIASRAVLKWRVPLSIIMEDL